jgi:ankyrin repeat protein
MAQDHMPASRQLKVTTVYGVQFLRKGADVDAANCDGDTALHLAAAARRQAVVKFLLLNGGVDTSSRNRAGHTYLEVLAKRA